MKWNPEIQRLVNKNPELAFLLITFANLWHINYEKDDQKDEALIQMLKYLHGEI